MSKYPPYVDGLPTASPLRRMGELAFDDGHLAAIAEIEEWAKKYEGDWLDDYEKDFLAKLNSMREGEDG